MIVSKSLRISLFLLFGVGLAGCTRSDADPKKPVEPVAALAASGPTEQPAGPKTPPTGAPGVPNDPGQAGNGDVPSPFFAAADPTTEKYDAAVTQALTLLADEKYADALAAFEAARGLKDNDFVRGEIEKVKARVDQQNVADKTVAEIRSVLDAGKAADASKLATQALGEFGDRSVAPQLLDLRVQADALQSVQAKEDDATRFARLASEGQAALDEKNYRAAAIAFEQALAIKPDPALAERTRDVRDRLDRYDGLRKQAAELRRDPAHLEQAIDLYRQAAVAWDTLQVRQEIDDCGLALERRRDTLAVMDFEVGGDLGVADAGRTVAEELLPLFKRRFDLVERDRLVQALADLKIDGPLADPAQQREAAEVARARYLILGSVRRLGPILVHARLVDARTGLIVQTARISADRVEDVAAQLPDLARQLLMTDDEKLAFDQQQVQQAKRIEPVAVDAPLPPPPAPDAAPQPFPVMAQAPPPDVGALQIAQFQALPPPPAVVLQTVVVVEPPPPLFRHRLLFANLQLGDALFRGGQIGAALRHYEFALTLAPGDFGIRARIARCHALLPPAFVVVQQPAIFAPLPRIAFVNFKVIGDPRFVAPILSTWTPQALVPYFRPQYEVVEPGEVYWMMGNLGMTVFDLINDPNARRWLGRSLNVQAFVFGTVEQTASFNVTTYMVNAEHGYLQGSGRVHVHNMFELKMRLGEIAQLTAMPAQQRVAYLGQQNQFDVLLGRGRNGLHRGELVVSIGALEQALLLRPGNMEVIVLLNQARSAHRRHELEELRRQEFLRREALAEAARRRQWELARHAEAVRIAAPVPAVAIADQRIAAYADLSGRARLAVNAGNFTLAVNLFKGALDVVPPPGPGVIARPLPIPHETLLGELARARAEADRADRNKAIAESAAARETSLRLAREKELDAARKKLAVEETRLQATRLALAQANETKYRAALEQGQALMGQGKYDAASSALQSARQFKKTEQLDAMLALSVQRQAEQNMKSAAEKTAFEEKLKAARVQAVEAETLSKKNHELYDLALKQAQAAQAAKKYDEAEAQYKAAVKLFRTDAAIAGMNQVASLRAADQRILTAQSQKSTRVAELLAAGKSAQQAGKFTDAVVKLQEARKLDPTNVDVLSALTQAEQSRDRAQTAAQATKTLTPFVAVPPTLPPKTKIDAPKIDVAKAAEVQKLMTSAKSAIVAHRYDEAITSLTKAQSLAPDDRAIGELMREAQSGQKAAASTTLANAQKLSTALTVARAAIKGSDFTAAAAQIATAKSLAPSDPQISVLERELAAARTANDTQQKTQAAFAAAMDKGNKALAAKSYPVAIQSFKEALDLQPTNPQARQLHDQAIALQTAAQQSAVKDTAYAQALKTAQQHLATKNYPAAIQAGQEALKLRPSDPAATQLIQQATTAQQSTAKDTAYAQALKTGQQHLATKNYPAAIQAAQEALKHRPSDPAATTLIQQATAGQQAAGKDVAYAQALQKAQSQFAAKNYAAAIQSAQEALRDRPNDPQATSILQQASSALNAAKTADQAELKKKASFNEAVQNGQRLIGQKKYAEALQSLQAANGLYPNDPTVTQLIQQAQQGLRTPPPMPPPIPKVDPAKKAAEEKSKKEADDRAKVQKHIADGQNHLNARRFPDAVREFEAALAIDGNNGQARALLQKAKTAK